MIFPVKGQCTVHGCKNEDSLISIVEEIQELFVKASRQQQKEQVQYIHEHFNASFQQLKNQQDTAVTNLKALDRCSQDQDFYIKQVQSTYEFLNVSFRQLKKQSDTVIGSLEAFDRRLSEYDISTKNNTQNSS